MLNLTRTTDEKVVIFAGDQRIEIMVCGFRRIRGRAPVVVLGFTAPPDVNIVREEVECRGR